MSVREDLLAAAAELIGERGWGAVSTRVLAERAGVRPGLVHYHFESMPALLSAAAVGAMREVVTGLEDVLAVARTPHDALAAMLADLDTHDMQALFTETYLAATRDEDLRAEVAAVLTEFRDRLARWLRQKGVPDPKPTAAVIAAAVDGVLLHRALDPSLTTGRVVPVLGKVFR